MAVSLKQAAKLGYVERERVGREVYSHLYRTGVKRPISVASIYIDRDGTASYKGKIVRRSDGTLLPYGTAQLTDQGKATREVQQTAATRELAGMIGQSRTVTSRQQLEARRERERQLKAEQDRKQAELRERKERERRERLAREEAARQAAEVQARKIVSRPSMPVLNGGGSSSSPAPSPTAAPAPAGTASPMSEPQLVPVQAVATTYRGVTILFLKP